MNTLLRSRLPTILPATALLAGLIASGGPPPAVAAPGTTAWQNESFVVDVTGAGPNAAQTAQVELWSPRTPTARAEVFTFSQDKRDWYPSGYWFWNLRMQVAANLSAGLPADYDGLLPTTVAISSGAAQQLAVRSPWPGQSVTIPAQPGRSYLVEKTGATAQPFQALSGTPATTARRYDKATIGLPQQSSGDVSLRAKANNLLVAADDAELVCAENGGAAPLIANRDAIGPWEQFDLIEGVA